MSVAGVDRRSVWGCTGVRRREVIQADCCTRCSAAGWRNNWVGSVGMGIECCRRGFSSGRSVSSIAGLSVGSDGYTEDRRTEGDGRNRRAAVAAWSDDGADGTDVSAAGRRRAVGSYDDEHCEGPVGLQHRTYLDHERHGGAELVDWGSFHRQALERVAALPGVQYAAFAWGVPLTGNNWPATLEIEGQPPAKKESDKSALPLRAVTPDYFKLMGVRLMEGREFRSTDDDKAPNVAIVNQAFVNRYFPRENPIGRKFWLNGRDKPATDIIGEISSSRTSDLTQEASPEIYLPLWQATAFSKHLVVRTTADPRALMVAVERELHAIDPTAAVENVKTLEQIRDDSLASRSFAMRLLIGFSLVGSALTLVGVYGVLSLSVASRRRELAIRTAVGARREDIHNLIFGEGFRLIVGGVLAGLALAILLSRVLRSFLFEVPPTDPATLIMVGALFVGVALLACWVPVRRAARIDPVEALRYE